VLDTDFIVENPDVVRRAIEQKRIDLDIDALLAAVRDTKQTLLAVEELRRQRNALSKQAGRASPEERAQLIEQSRTVGEKLKGDEEELRARQDALRSLLLQVPNIPAADEPVGSNESDNVELRRVGNPPTFDFEARDHVELLELNGWAELARIGQVAGSRSYALRGEAALLELAVLRLALDMITARGFVPVTLPSMAREAAFSGTGHFPAGREDVYQVEDDLYLSGTSEVSLNALHSGEILAGTGLPVQYAGFSACFRREAGAAGRDVRGLLRVHQFYKVEQYVMCAADKEESRRWFETLLSNAEALLQALELPYRIVQTCTGEMGAGKVRMWDIESWIPTQREYRETHSNSEFYDWQARRADLRYRDGDGKVRYAYTLNNTVVATPRILVPLLEVHQQADGSARVPAALRPYMNDAATLGGPGA
jgi:seryl-tRNA synthetase